MRELPRLLAWALLAFLLNTVLGLVVALDLLAQDLNGRAVLSVARSVLTTVVAAGLYLAVRAVRRDALVHQDHNRLLRSLLIKRLGKREQP